MVFAIVPRSEIGVPPPNGRPLLTSGQRWLLAHYTGVNGYDDQTRDVDYAKSVARYGAAAGKAFEYNYLIGLGGTIFEQAGYYRAAHCLNFNPDSIGILLMLGIGVQPTEAMIDSFCWLRDHLVTTHQLAPVHSPVPHYRFRATGCPGATLAALPGKSWPSPTGQGSLGELRAELLEAWVPPPPPIEEDDMAVVVFDVKDDPAFLVGYANIAGVAIQVEWIATEERLDAFKAAPGVVVKTGFAKAAFKTCTCLGPVPTGWGKTDFAGVVGG